MGNKISEAKQIEVLQFLRSKYKENPCKTLSTAFWKIYKPLNELNVSFNLENDNIKKLILSDDKRVLLYWQPVDENVNLTVDLSNKEFFVIHEQYQNFIPESVNREKIHKYFRLVHFFKNIPSLNLPDGFQFQEVSINSELTDICDFLNLCYSGSHFNESTIKSWTLHPVFNQELWVWIIDTQGTNAALGIAEFDEDIHELSLEWIQVHPSFRKRGLGKCLVYELLIKGSGDSVFATVSGLEENETNPEQLYRSCGFSGQDKWLIYTKN